MLHAGPGAQVAVAGPTFALQSVFWPVNSVLFFHTAYRRRVSLVSIRVEAATPIEGRRREDL